MRVLVTGAAGFVAPYMVRELCSRGHEVAATDVVARPDSQALSCEFTPCDLCSVEAVRALVEQVRPDACIHLAGVSFVPDAAKNPGRLYAINVGGTLNLLDALVEESPGTRFLFVSTAQAYGCTFNPNDAPVIEEAPLYPLSPYAISKVASESATRAYGLYRGLDIRIARPSNHTGPGQSPKFVAPSFVAQAREILAGTRTSYSAGNLDSGRDFSDVRDVVAAYADILEHGERGTTYNICASHRITIRALLNRIMAISGAQAPIETNPAFYRPTDFSRLLDTSRLRALCWVPRYNLDTTLKDMLNH
ncbi:MAG: GDP-mannose 4,6-dehydratase [Kiritimatiellae bacterium]|nr:GDP-mannose 4,6-dehydratase [Kiritimatiellia bacterium]